MAIKDKIALGAAAGVAASVPSLLLNLVSVWLGFAKYYDFEIAASVYLYPALTHRAFGRILGGLVWEFLATGLGILTVLLLEWTGKAYWWLKGLLVSNLVMFIFIYGFYYALGAPKIVPWDLATNWSLFLENIVFGLCMGYFAAKWGE